MRLLTRAQLRFLRLAPWSTLTALVGVALGVSSVVAVHQISRQVAVGLESLRPAPFGAVSHFVSRPGLSMADYFELRARWRAGELPAVRGVMPLVEGQVALRVVAADTSGSAATVGRAVRLVGLDAFAGIPAAAPLALLGPRDVVAAESMGVEAGTVVQIGGRRHVVSATYAGLPADMLLSGIGTAQEALGRSPEALSRIAAVVETPSMALLTLADRLLPGIASGLDVSLWRLPDWTVQSMDDELPGITFGRAVLFNLGALGSLALVVAWLLVYQVSVMWLRRRRETFERLRQIGVSNAELGGAFLVSLLGLGLVASLIGIPLGALLAMVLLNAVTAYAEPASGAGLTALGPLDGWLLLKGLGSGVLVTALGGAYAAAREVEARRVLALGRVGLLAMVLAGAYGLLGSGSLVGGFTGIAALAVLTLASIEPLLKRLRGVSRKLRGGLLARLGARELVWYPGDLAVAVGALMLALATSVALGLMVDSFRQDFEQMLEQRLARDLYVTGSGGSIERALMAVKTWPAVDSAQRYGRSTVSVGPPEPAGTGSSDGGPQSAELGYTRFDAVETARYGLSRALKPGECLLSERLARGLRVTPGDTVAVAGMPFRVAAVFAGFGEAVPRVLLDESDARRIARPLAYDRLSIATTHPEGVAARLLALEPSLALQDRAGLRRTALAVFDRTFSTSRALTVLALLVAGVGLYNALLNLALARGQVDRLLTALGLSASERRRIGAFRVLGVAGAAVVLAAPLGVAMGWLLCRVINPRAFGWSIDLTFSAAAVGWPLLAAAAAALLVLVVPVPREGELHAGIG